LQQTSVLGASVEPNEFEKDNLQKYLSEFEFKSQLGHLCPNICREIRQEWER
jgi:hypothetical protein